MAESLRYFVVKDSNRARRLEALGQHSDALAGFEVARSSTRVGSTRASSELTGIHPELSFSTHDLSADDVEGFGKEQARDPNTEAQGIFLPVSPIAFDEAQAAENPVSDEIAGDEAAAAAEPDNWGIRELFAEARDKYDGSSASVAIIDSGIDKDHQAFAGATRILEDFTGLGDPTDSSGHGTHCLATIAGRNVGGRHIGVAPGVQRLISARIFAKGIQADADMVLRALDWCLEQQADVISMSLGFDLVNFMTRLETEFDMPRQAALARCLLDFQNNIRLFDAFSIKLAAHETDRKKPGTVVVAAAGNGSRRLSAIGQHPYTIPATPPASAIQFISVGALRRVGDKLGVAGYSNGMVTLMAPGSGIVSARSGSKDALQTMSGTSMACPHVAGLAALWWDAVRQGPARKSAEIVKARLLSSANYKRFVSNPAEADYGHGLPQAP